MSASLIVRSATPADRPALRRAVVALQDHERSLHSTRLPGERIAEAYLDWMPIQAEANGAVLVAERGDCFAGFVAGWIETEDNLGETPDSNRFGYISDICVMPEFRGRRIAARLLKEIERHFRHAGIVRLHINALAMNTAARKSYEHAGFAPYEIIHEKRVSGENDA